MSRPSCLHEPADNGHCRRCKELLVAQETTMGLEDGIGVRYLTRAEYDQSLEQSMPYPKLQIRMPKGNCDVCRTSLYGDGSLCEDCRSKGHEAGGWA